MNNLFLKEKTRLLHSHLWGCTVSFFCVLGIAISIPIQAQPKPKKALMPSISSYIPSEYKQVGNTMLWYYQSSSSIDFMGCFDGQYYGSTYGNYGYRAAMQVNDGYPSSVDCLNGSTIDGVNFMASVEQQGELARVLYTVTNTTETDAVVSLGAYADVMIGNNDRAPITRRKDTTDSTYGLTMMDGNGVQLCVLFGAGLAGVSPVSDYWFGYYSTNSGSYEIVGNYYQGGDYLVENGSYDSGMGWCWKNRTIPAGETVVFSYLIGVGDVNLQPNSTFEVTPDDPEGWNDLNRPHVLTLEGTYESPAGVDGMIEYAVEDSEEWHQLTEMIPSGSTFNNSLVAMFDASRNKHVIRFRTRDNVGNTTLLPSIEYLDVSYHEYTSVQDKTYTGDSIYQDIQCVDMPSLEFTTKYYNNTNAGLATVSIEGVFPTTIGRKTNYFHINPLALTGDITLSNSEYVFDGQSHYPTWSFTNEAYTSLEEDKDYTVSYSNNTYPGTATVRVAGKGNYTSQLTQTFTISKATLTNSLYSITLPASDISYDGKEHKAEAYKQGGVGEVIFTYTKHNDSAVLEGAPIEEGYYDIYAEIADGDWYYGKAKEYIGSFSIYRFDEAEWAALEALYTEMQQMGSPLPWNMSEGAKNVSTFSELKIKEGHAISLVLAGKGMTGTFPSALASLPQLEEINLSSNALSGNLSDVISALKQQNASAFSNLKKLDISYNNLSGNLGVLGECMPNLNELNASYNKFEELTPAMPVALTSLDITNQKMDKVVELNLSEMKASEIVNITPSILRYDHSIRGYKDNVTILLTKADLDIYNPYNIYTSEDWTMQLSYNNTLMEVMPYGSTNEYHGNSGDILNVLNMNAYDASSFRAALSFSQGDANFMNGVDATDLQATILYAFGDYRSYPFNFTAADTYKDDVINVQDVICTVNILLDSATGESANAKPIYINKVEENSATTMDADAYIYMKDGKIFLHSSTPVASLSIKAAGNIKWNLQNSGMQQSTANANIVAYSLNGATLPSNEDVILGEYTQASLHSVSLSDQNAQPISVGILNGSATSINGITETTSDNTSIFDVSGYNRGRIQNGINIIRSNGVTRKIFKK